MGARGVQRLMRTLPAGDALAAMWYQTSGSHFCCSLQGNVGGWMPPKLAMNTQNVSGATYDAVAHLMYVSVDKQIVAIDANMKTRLVAGVERGPSSGLMDRPKALAFDASNRWLYVVDGQTIRCAAMGTERRESSRDSCSATDIQPRQPFCSCAVSFERVCLRLYRDAPCCLAVVRGGDALLFSEQRVLCLYEFETDQVRALASLTDAVPLSARRSSAHIVAMAVAPGDDTAFVVLQNQREDMYGDEDQFLGSRHEPHSDVWIVDALL